MTTVGVEPEASAAFAAAQLAVWASLPASLTVCAGGAPHLVAVTGADPNWPLAVTTAITRGADGVLIVHPCVVRCDAVRAIAESTHAVILVQARWASHPAVADWATAARRTLGSTLSSPGLVDAVAIVAADDLRSDADILLDQLALVRAAGIKLSRAQLAVAGPHGYTVDGTSGVSVIALSCVRSAVDRPRAQLTLYGATGETHIAVPADGTASAAVAWTLDGSGQTVLPSCYESAARSSWRRLSAALGGDERPNDLRQLAEDLDAVATITVGWPTAG